MINPMEIPTNLEQEIADIERRLAEKKALQQVQGEQPVTQERDILHEVVSEKAQEFAPSYQPSTPLPQSSLPPTDNVLPSPVSEPPSYLSDELKTKVQDLVNIAFTKGLAEAVKEVSKMNNPAVLDAFHDVLVDQLYEVLVERGKLEKI
ncbi:MAG: hypothetical protein HYT63_02960 [Candidatus Yanofskybacteria bacterium]|nr:hypothetical protein [Candidatus Yanofskybacteria bacterium]